MFACKGSHLITVITLVGHGANANIRNSVSHALRYRSTYEGLIKGDNSVN